MSETFTIQEASRISNVSKHTLRFWERAMDGVIVPLRSKGGQRRYTRHNLLIIADIKNLRKKGYSLSDIEKKLNNKKTANDSKENLDKIDMLANQIAEVVKSSIYDFLSEDED